MAAIVYLDSLGRYAVTRNDSIVYVGDKCLWRSERELRAEATACGVALPPLVIDTRWNQHGNLP